MKFVNQWLQEFMKPTIKTMGEKIEDIELEHYKKKSSRKEAYFIIIQLSNGIKSIMKTNRHNELDIIHSIIQLITKKEIDSDDLFYNYVNVSKEWKKVQEN